MHHHPLHRHLVACLSILFLLSGCSGPEASGGAGLDNTDRTDAEIAGSDDAVLADRPVGTTTDRQFRDPTADGYDPVDDAVVRPVLDDWAEPDSLLSSDGIPDELAMVSVTPQDLIDQAAAAIAAAEPGASVLDAVGPLDSSQPGPVGRDGRRRNSSGELVTLDQVALGACGNAEIALTLAESGDDRALDHLVTASDLVRTSGLPSAHAWADHLSETVLRGTDTERAALVAFLAVCAVGGYEL
jgi:hypothetical protein